MIRKLYFVKMSIVLDSINFQLIRDPIHSQSGSGFCMCVDVDNLILNVCMDVQRAKSRITDNFEEQQN